MTPATIQTRMSSSGRAELGGHEAGLLEDAGADDRADAAGDGGDQAELAAELAGTVSIRVRHDDPSVAADCSLPAGPEQGGVRPESSHRSAPISVQ